MKHAKCRVDTLKMVVKPCLMGGPKQDLDAGTEYTVFDLHLIINGIDLAEQDSSDDDLFAIDDSQIWLAQRYNRASWILTCTCGEPECAGFHEPVATSRAGGRLTWTFPASYFKRLRARGLVAGAPRPVTFVFDANLAYDEFEAAQSVVRQYESAAGHASAFSAGCQSKPYHHLNEQYIRAEAWHLRQNKQRRYARYIGTRAGVCAGAPSPN
jgi:hypothetical protein